MFKRIEKDDVQEAMKQLVACGEPLTQRKIREITGGSFSTIGKLQRQINDEAEMKGHYSKLSDNLLSAIVSEINVQVQNTTQNLQQCLNEVKRIVIEQLDCLSDYESKIENIENELTVANSLNIELRQEYEKAEAAYINDIRIITERLQGMESEQKQLIAIIDTARTDSEKSKLRLELADQTAAKAELRASALESELKELEKARHLAEKKSAVAEQRSADLSETIVELRANIMDLRAENRAQANQMKDLFKTIYKADNISGKKLREKQFGFDFGQNDQLASDVNT